MACTRLLFFGTYKTFFDHIDFDVLRRNGRKYGFPPVLLEMAIASYKWPRFIANTGLAGQRKDNIATCRYVDDVLSVSCVLCDKCLEKYVEGTYAPKVLFENCFIEFIEIMHFEHDLEGLET